jgi:hypothetical protein
MVLQHLQCNFQLLILFFSKVRIDFSRVLKLVCLWCWRIPVSEAYIHAQVSEPTAVDFYNFLPESAHTIVAHDP